MVSNPAFFRGPEMQVWVSCFWGDFRVGGPIFGHSEPFLGFPEESGFGVPQDLRFRAPRGVLWCQTQHFLGAQRCKFGFLVLGVILGWGGPFLGHPESFSGFPEASDFGVPRI